MAEGAPDDFAGVEPLRGWPPPVAAAGGGRAEPLRAIVAADLAGLDVPPRRWLVEGVIPAGNVTLLGGDGGAGKSLLLLQLCAAVAAGWPSPWPSPGQGGAVYLSAEDDAAELHRRLARIGAAEGRDLAELGALHLIDAAGADATLGRSDPARGWRATAALDELERIAREAEAAVIGLDSAADLFGGNEIARAEVRAFVASLRGLARRTGASVVLLGHPSLEGLRSGSGLSGSTAWHNSVRSRLVLDRPEAGPDGAADPDARRLRLVKSNYASAGTEWPLRWSDGRFVLATGPDGLDRLAEAARAERVVVAALRVLEARGTRCSAAPSRSYAPAVILEAGLSEGLSRDALRPGMEAALKSGTLALEEIGAPSKRRRVLKVVGEV